MADQDEKKDQDQAVDLLEGDQPKDGEELIDLDGEDSLIDVFQKRLRDRGERLSDKWLGIFRAFGEVLRKRA